MRVVGTLGYVLHRVSRFNGRGMHKRENFLMTFVMLWGTLPWGASVRGSEVIGSSEQVHVVDALAITGDEGRSSLR